jgi:hypothetical protein
MEKAVKAVKRNNRGFGYLIFVSGSHDHIKTRVWVHNLLIQTKDEREFVQLPLQGRIYKTKKGSLVLRLEKGFVYFVQISSGYRGSASINEVKGSSVETVATGSEYHSGQGALGETAWALVNAQGPIEVFGRRTGRRVDNPEVSFRLTPDGEREELVTDQEVCDLME